MGSNSIKRLTGETLIYGASTILARVLNFLLIPLFTYNLQTADFGITSNFMAYIAIFQVILVFGLETGCFKFVTDKQKDNPQANSDDIYSTAAGTVLVISLFFSLICFVFQDNVKSLVGYDGSSLILFYVCFTLVSDSITAIFFARLRQENRAWKFAIFKSIKILTELGFNLLFFLFIPFYFEKHTNSLLLNFISAKPDYTYLLFSIFLSAVASLLLFLPQMLRPRAFIIKKSLWRPMLLYSFPLMISQLAGIVNDMFDRVLFRYCVTQGWKEQLGIFAACAKLAIFINLGIQMFRYAADSFFFKEFHNQDHDQLYSRILNYFTAVMVFIGLGIVFYMDFIKFFIGPPFRVGLFIVPIMVLANISFGIYTNISYWYKLTSNTWQALPITLSGLAMTALVNILFLNRFGYVVAALGHLFSYLTMIAVCVAIGRHKKLIFNYNWKRVGTYIGIGILLFVVSRIWNTLPFAPRFIINNILLVIYLILVLRIEGITAKNFFDAIKGLGNKVLIKLHLKN